MQWQDWVFSVGGFILLASLIPTIRGEQKPALSTSIMFAALITIFSVTMATLDLWLSAVANAGNAAAWAVLAVQRYSAVRREKREGVVEQLEEELRETIEAPGEH